MDARASLLRARTLAVSGLPSGRIGRAWLTESVDFAALLEDAEIMVALQLAYETHDNAHAVLLANRQRIQAILDLIKVARDRQR